MNSTLSQCAQTNPHNNQSKTARELLLEGMQSLFEAHGPYPLVIFNDGQSCPCWLDVRTNAAKWQSSLIPSELTVESLLQWLTSCEDSIHAGKAFWGRGEKWKEWSKGERLKVANDLALLCAIASEQAPQLQEIFLEIKTHYLQTGAIVSPALKVVQLDDSSQNVCELEQDSTMRLLRVFTNNVSDNQFKKANQVLTNEKLSANEKLFKIDNLIRIPSKASAEQLGNMLGVTKQAILKTEWWIENRKGEKASEIGHRMAMHKSRAEISNNQE